MAPDVVEEPGHSSQPDLSQAGSALAGSALDSGGEEAAQSELDLGMVSTGSVEVDRALAPLESLDERPVAEHAEIFGLVLGELAETMTGPPAAPAAAPAVTSAHTSAATPGATSAPSRSAD